MKRKVVISLKISLILILLLLSVYLSFPQRVTIPPLDTTNGSGILLLAENLQEPGVLQTIRRVIGRPLRLENYDLYINSFNEEDDAEDCEYMSVTLENVSFMFNNENKTFAFGTRAKFGTLKMGQLYDFNDEYEISSKLKFFDGIFEYEHPCRDKINPVIEIYGRADKKESFLIGFIIFISLLALLMLEESVRDWAVG